MKDESRKRSPVAAFAVSHKLIAFFAVVLLALPVLSILPQMLPYKFIPMTPGEVVSFYGTAGAVIWAICAYVLSRNDQMRDREIEEQRRAEKEGGEHIPRLCLEVKGEKDGLIELCLTNIGSHLVKHVFIEDHYLATCIKSEMESNFALPMRHLSDDNYASGNINFIVVDDIQFDMVREDGYPCFICFYVEDMLDRPWRAEFVHSQNGRQHIYFEKDVVEAES